MIHALHAGQTHRPSMAGMLALALASSSSFMLASLPAMAAACSGVRPSAFPLSAGTHELVGCRKTKIAAGSSEGCNASGVSAG